MIVPRSAESFSDQCSMRSVSKSLCLPTREFRCNGVSSAQSLLIDRKVKSGTSPVKLVFFDAGCEKRPMDVVAASLRAYSVPCFQAGSACIGELTQNKRGNGLKASSRLRANTRALPCLLWMNSLINAGLAFFADKGCLVKFHAAFRENNIVNKYKEEEKLV